MKEYKNKQFDLRLCDNMELMAQYPDNYFDLAVVDPPYGIGFGEYNRTNRANDGSKVKANKYKNSNWDDKIPSEKYFQELKRVSINQIVWGGNYFPSLWENGCKGFIFWYKGNPILNYAAGELAFTSFNKVAKQFDFRYYGNIQGKTSAENKIHPTQKPVALYKWIFTNYAKQGDKILDTHLGSMSIAVAVDSLNKVEKMDLHLTGCEIDQEYFDKGIERLKRAEAQLSLF